MMLINNHLTSFLVKIAIFCIFIFKQKEGFSAKSGQFQGFKKREMQNRALQNRECIVLL